MEIRKRGNVTRPWSRGAHPACRNRYRVHIRNDVSSLDQRSSRFGVGVMTVDDQAVFRRAAREVIEATDGFDHLGDAGSGEEALALAGELDPDLVLVDVRMPGIGRVRDSAPPQRRTSCVDGRARLDRMPRRPARERVVRRGGVRPQGELRACGAPTVVGRPRQPYARPRRARLAVSRCDARTR